mmetsp:Transcript_119492/g.283678  ORF Transcript_119492/g.283678 Transcript_119492/m.283678 type:complete len:345 (-) Transcript_119492:88-1122(-)
MRCQLDVAIFDLPLEFSSVAAMPHDDVCTVGDLTLAHAGTVSAVQRRLDERTLDLPNALVHHGLLPLIRRHRQAQGLGGLAAPQHCRGNRLPAAGFADGEAVVLVVCINDGVAVHLPLELVAGGAAPEDHVLAIRDATLADGQAVLGVRIPLDVLPIPHPSNGRGPRAAFCNDHCRAVAGVPAERETLGAVRLHSQELAIEGPLVPHSVHRPQDEIRAVHGVVLAHRQDQSGICLVLDELPVDVPVEGRVVVALPQDHVRAGPGLALPHAQAVGRIRLVLDVQAVHFKPVLVVFGAMPEDDICAISHLAFSHTGTVLRILLVLQIFVLDDPPLLAKACALRQQG